VHDGLRFDWSRVGEKTRHARAVFPEGYAQSVDVPTDFQQETGETSDIRDWFKDPWDVFDFFDGEFDSGTPYRISADWRFYFSW